MRKIQFLVLAVSFLLVTGCSEVEEAVDASECLLKLARLSDNSDDLSCSELISAFKSLENSCGSFDGELQETIDALEANCED